MDVKTIGKGGLVWRAHIFLPSLIYSFRVLADSAGEAVATLLRHAPYAESEVGEWQLKREEE